MWPGHILLYGSMTAIYIGVCAVVMSNANRHLATRVEHGFMKAIVIILNKKIRRLADFLLDDLL